MTNENPRTTVKSRLSVSTQVVEAVADTVGVDPLELEPLSESIDLDSLDSLFESSTESHQMTYLEFTIRGCKVSVYGDGEIDVIPPEDVPENEDRSQIGM